MCRGVKAKSIANENPDNTYLRAHETKMKTFILFLMLIFLSPMAHGGNELSVMELNADLVTIYERLIADGQPTELIGEILELTLKLKFSSEKHLLFSDTQIIVDKNTKYYLIKWKYNPIDIKAIIGKSNIECKVKARIIEVVKGATSPNMLYIVEELLSVEP